MTTERTLDGEGDESLGLNREIQRTGDETSLLLLSDAAFSAASLQLGQLYETEINRSSEPVPVPVLFRGLQKTSESPHDDHRYSIFRQEEEKRLIIEEVLNYASRPIQMDDTNEQKQITASQSIQGLINKFRKRLPIESLLNAPKCCHRNGFLKLNMQDLLMETGKIRSAFFQQTEFRPPIQQQISTGETQRVRQTENLVSKQQTMERPVQLIPERFMKQKAVDLKELHFLLSCLKRGTHLEDEWEDFYRCLHIRPRNHRFDRKSVTNNINYKMKNLLISHPQLRYYGDEKYFTISILAQVPDILIKERDQQLLSQIREIYEHRSGKTTS